MTARAARLSLRHHTVETPVGRLRLFADAKGLVSLDFVPAAPEEDELPENSREDRAAFAAAEAALETFFAGRALPRVPLGERAGTAFQRKVWEAIAKIPWGETRSYGEIAEAIGHPGASRAVGTACGRNPLPIFVPCHRVLAARGAIGGYGYLGVEMKKKLLRLEGRDG